MNAQTKRFLLLSSAGLAGVFSFLLVDLTALTAVLPIPAGAEVPPITGGLKLLSLLQSSILLFVAVLVGVALAPKVGLTSPVAEAAARGTDLVTSLKPQIVPGIGGGVAGGVAIVLVSAVWRPFLPPEVVARISEFGRFVPLVTRLLYGGVTEELLIRWGLMTLLVWAAWRLFQKGRDKPRPAYFVAAILISSIVFGIGHLPIAFLLFPQPTVGLVVFVVLANSLFGLIAGYLYWKKGLEAAMIAHIAAHILMFTASRFGVYF
jgi:hypothetical protein